MKKVREEVFAAFFRNLGGSSDEFIVALISSAN